jgi:hypothetical protein
MRRIRDWDLFPGYGSANRFASALQPGCIPNEVLLDKWKIADRVVNRAIPLQPTPSDRHVPLDVGHLLVAAVLPVDVVAHGLDPMDSPTGTAPRRGATMEPCSSA